MTGAGSGGQGPADGPDPEEPERCPICLGVLSGADLAMPDSCCHVFCLSCLVTWAELQVSPSCPVDRRPFTNVYRWDGHLSCVQVSVRRRVTPHETESYCRRNSQHKTGLNRKLGRGLRRKKGERTVDGKAKGLVRKCNDEDPSSLRRKKVRGVESCSWSPPGLVSLTTTHDIAQSVVEEEVMCDHRLERCKPQVQSCMWLSPAAPISANCTSRESFHPSFRNSSMFPFGFDSSPFSSSPVSGSSHFVFEGVVCAITCPKGGEKKGGRASKASTKESVTPKRSGRSSKSQEQAAVSDPSPPQPSGASDSEAPPSPPTRAGRAPQTSGKRKGKQVTNRKASGKRKAPARKKRSPEVVSSSPEEEEEEEEGAKGDTADKEEENHEEDVNDSEHPLPAEESLNSEQNNFNQETNKEEPLTNDVSREGSETQDEKVDPSSLLESAPYSPTSASPDNRSVKDDEPDSPGPAQEQDSSQSDFKNAPSPEQENDHMDISEGSEAEEEQNDRSESPLLPKETKEESPKEDKTDVNPFQAEDSLSPGQSDKNAPEINSITNSQAAEKDNKNASPPENTADVPMDFGSPLSEHGNTVPLEQSKETPVLADKESRLKDDTNKAHTREQREKEKSPERKSDRPRRSRFHSPTSSWSPKRDSRRDQMGSRSREQNGSPPSNRSSGQSRERDRDDDRERHRRDRSGERSRDRSQDRSGDRSQDRSGDRSQDRSGDRSQDRSWDRSQDRSRDRSQDRSGDRSQDRSRDRSQDRSGDRSQDRSGDRSQDRSGDRSQDRSGDRSWDRSQDRSGEKSQDRSGDGSQDRSRQRRRRRSRSRSRSRSRNRSYRRVERSPDRPGSREEERRAGWRSGGDGRKSQGGAGRFENGLQTLEGSPEQPSFSENPDWVTEKIRSVSSRWEEQRGAGNRAESKGRGSRGGFERGRDSGRGGGGRSFYNQQEETGENRWPRNNFSGNNSGNDAYSRFNENRGRRKDQEPSDAMDRSGWSSASSWAVRRTLPADVQDYYSKRERGGSGGWSRPEEEQTPASDPPKSDPPSQAVPGNAPVPVLMPPQLNVLHHYPIPGPRGPLPVSLQPAAPYALPPSQVPMHLHPAVPLLQVPAVGAQGLPPPPPPPPPMQQGSQTAVALPDGHPTQMTGNMAGFAKPALLQTPTKAGAPSVTQVLPVSGHVLPSSTTQHNRAQADSSKKEKKQQIQEKAINEVKNAIKPYYQKKEITKEEYKEIVRKAVEKICHSKSGEVNSSKVANLVKAYVDKYKHARKK